MASEVPDEGRLTSSPRWWSVILVWALVIGLLGLLGFSVIRTQMGSLGVGTQVPDFTLTTFDGDEISIADLRGKVVVINFWASWCITCEQEAAELENAYQMFKNHGVVFLGVDYVDTESEARAYLMKFGITYPSGPDLGTRISQAFRIRGVPETYIVDAYGRLAHIRIGPYRYMFEIVDAIEGALGQ
jgi:cytochrome c biogenesis protein CcmG/thiol:disulfide interchange protein DsbE